MKKFNDFGRNVLKDSLYLSGNERMYKRLYFIGIPAYIIMLVLSVLFYKERTILTDAAYNLFYFVFDKSFFIPSYRFGEALSQLLPFIAVKGHLSLAGVAVSYSVGFILYYFLCYVTCGTVLKRYDLALIILLQNVLFVSDSFYFIASPLSEALAMLMVALAMLAREKRRKPLVFALEAALAVTIAFYHPIALIAVVFISVFFSLKQGVIPKKNLIVFAACFFGAIAIKMLFFRVQYEAHSFSGLKNFIRLFPDYFTIYSNQQFLRCIITKYYWVFALFMTVAIFYSFKREWKKLLLFVAFFLGYLMLVNVTYPTAATPVFYIENLYLPLGTILAVPVIFDIAPVNGVRNVVPVLFILLIGTFFIRIYYTHQTYAARLGWERRFIQQHAHEKIIYPESKVPMDTLIMAWGTPYEFWLLSTIESGNTASLIIDKNPAERWWASDLRSSLLVNWNTYSYKKLDSRYFHFTDTTTGYVIY